MAVATAAVAALGVFTGTASAITIVVNPNDGADLSCQLAGANPGDVLVLSGVYFTEDAGAGCGTSANGFEVPAGVTVTGPLGKKGVCTSNANAVIDGDGKPATLGGSGTPGHVGPGFNIEGDGVTIQCLTIRQGTTGITDAIDGTANGLTVNTVAFRSNDRDNSICGACTDPQSSGVWMQDSNFTTIMNSYFSGQGSYGIYSAISAYTNNDSWNVLGNTFDQVGAGCVRFDANSNSSIGMAVFNAKKNAWVVSKGNTCNLSYDDHAFYVAGVTVGATPPANHIAGNKILNAKNDCIYNDSDASIIAGNSCNLSANGYLLASHGAGDQILSNSFGAGLFGVSADDLNVVINGNSITKVNDTSGSGQGIYAVGNGATVSNNTIGVAYQQCIQTDGTGAQITGNSCGLSRDDDGIEANGDNSMIKDNKLGVNYDDCVNATAGSPTIKNNKCVSSQWNYGYEFSGNGTATVNGNSVSDSYNAGFYASNSGAAGSLVTMNSNSVGQTTADDCYDINVRTLTADGNKAGNCYNDGFNLIAWDNPLVTNNKVTNTHFGEMLYVECDNTCSGGKVNNNTLDESSQDGYVGLEVNNGTGCDTIGCGMTVSGNTVKHSTDDGLLVTNNGFTLTKNKITHAGVYDEAYGLHIVGNHNSVTTTSVSGSFDSGIWLDGDNNTLDAQTSVTDNGEDGITLSAASDANVISNNTIKGNLGDGLDNFGTNTVISNNTMTGNRQDCAGEAGSTTNPAGVAANPALGGNVCNDGSDFTQAGTILKPTRR